MTECRLAVCGGGGSGKSTLIIQYLEHHYSDEEYNPTIEENYTKHIYVHGETLVLDILDTAGQEEYESLRSTYMDKSDGFLLIFDITNDASFAEVDKFVKQILEVKQVEKCPMVSVIVHVSQQLSNTIINVGLSRYQMRHGTRKTG
jgi:GTPase KRas protein